MTHQTEESTYTGLMHAGAGSGLVLVQVSALIPGLLPSIALAAVFALPLLVPVVVLGILAAPPAGVWWLVKRIRARHRLA
jgi:hypothetical protein